MSLANLFLKKNYMLLTLLLAVCAFVFDSCKKSTTNDDSLIPSNGKSKTAFVTNFKVNAVTVKSDSVRTDITVVSLLGSYIDPVFGMSKASVATQLFLPIPNVDFGTNPMVDSLVLAIRYKDAYGSVSSINDGQVLEAYELTQNLTTKPYYSNESINGFYNPSQKLCAQWFMPKLYDSVIVDGVKRAPQLRVRLANQLGQKLLLAGGNGQQGLQTNESFVSIFKGLYLTVNNVQSSGQGSILSFDLLSTDTKMTLYYHNDAGSQLKYDFTIAGSSPRFNVFEHNYAGTAIEKQLNGTALDTNKVYIQTMGGVETKLMLPFLNTFKDSANTIINKAELVLNIEESSNYPPPAKLYLLAINADGTTTVTKDMELESATYVNGLYNTDTKQYVFNMARHMQAIMSGSVSNYGFILYPLNDVVSANRVIIKAKNDIQFNLTYTKY